jgi:hypothetical protein
MVQGEQGSRANGSKPEKASGEIERLAAVLEPIDLPPERRAALLGRYLAYASWLDHAARRAQRTHYALRMTALIGGILLPAVAGLDAATGSAALRWVTAGIGVVVGATAALDGFLSARGRWLHYRSAAEALQAELWQYALLHGKHYEMAPSHAHAFPALATECEQFIATEVAGYLADATQEEESPVAGQPAVASG